MSSLVRRIMDAGIAINGGGAEVENRLIELDEDVTQLRNEISASFQRQVDNTKTYAAAADAEIAKLQAKLRSLLGESNG